MLSENRQSRPGSPLRAQMRRTSFGGSLPRRRQDWFPTSETSRQSLRFTVSAVKFRISTYSSTLLTVMISTAFTRVGVAVAGGIVGGLVIVGSGVALAGSGVCVGTGERVGGGVRDGNALGNGSVGKGVRVGKSKSNSGVGVGCVPSLVDRIGLATEVGGVRWPSRNRLTNPEQVQQNSRNTSPGIRTLTHGRCWLYAARSLVRYEFSCSKILLSGRYDC